MIRAEIRSKDLVRKEEFDATKWFSSASAEEIYLLYRTGWCGNRMANTVALALRLSNIAIADVLGYAREVGDFKFEVSINPEDALKWLKENRPEVISLIERYPYD